MPHLVVCRVCLTGSVKVYPIVGTSLQAVYETLTNIQLCTSDHRPKTVCYLCRSQLEGCGRFQLKSLKSEDILTELFRNNIEITPATVAVLNKEIQQSFSIKTLESVSYHQVEANNIKEEALEANGMMLVHKREATDVASVCRACLSAEFTTRAVRNDLRVVYDRLTSTKLGSCVVRPAGLCYVCMSQLRRYRSLVGRCDISEGVLTELLHNGVQLTQSIVSMLNSKKKPVYLRSAVTTTSYAPAYELTVTLKLEPCDSDTGRAVIKTEDSPLRETNQNQITDVAIPNDEFYTEMVLNDTVEINLESCDVCDYTCNSERKLKKHLRLHDPKRKYVCDLCSRRYKSSSNLYLHKLKIHTTKYECFKCQKVFNTIRRLNAHILTHEKGLLSCETCGKMFKHRKFLREHYYSVHKGKHACPQCRYTSASLEWVKEHIHKSHSRCVCDVCHVSVSGRKAMKRHLLNHSAIKPFQCKTCLKTFATKQMLNSHTLSHTGERPHICGICGKRYREKSYLKAHYDTHGEKKYECHICGREFHRKSVLHNHMISHTPEKLFACEICDMKFLRRVYVKKHMETHKEDKTFKCRVCQRTFKTGSTLKTHLLVHNGQIKSYTCDVCGKQFTRKCYLVCHLKFHYGVKPFPCKFCDKSFTTKEIQQAHSRTHTGEKPYVCILCDRAFSQSCALKRHIKAHAQEKPYECTVCNKKFAEKLSLHAHNHLHRSGGKLICDYCNCVFIDKEKFVHHILKHSVTNPYKCQTCGKSFQKLSTLTQHVKYHVTELRCVFCELRFKSPHQLYRHNTLKHAAIKRYACNVCERAFDGLVRLNAHLRGHSGAKQFGCEMCTKTYVERRDLLHHMKSIHKYTTVF